MRLLLLAILICPLIGVSCSDQSSNQGKLDATSPADLAVTDGRANDQSIHSNSDGGPMQDASPKMDGGNVPVGTFCTAAAHALFDPQVTTWLVPFPSNFWSTDDPGSLTGIRLYFDPQLTPSDLGMFLQYPNMQGALEKLDGFGTLGGVVFGFSDSMAPAAYNDVHPDATVSPGSPVVLLDIDPASPAQGQAIAVELKYVENKNNPGASNRVLIARPLVPLRPKTTYAAMLGSRVKTATSNCLAPSPLMKKLLLGTASGPGFDRLTPDVPRATELLLQSGFISSLSDIAALTIFTTQSIHEEMRAIVDDVDDYAQQAGYAFSATLEDDGPFDTTVAHRIKGTFQAIRYLGPDGHISFQGGKPVRAGFNQLSFHLLLPKETDQYKPPFKVAIVQHGLSGSIEELVEEGPLLAGIGVATIGINAPHHGDRLPPLTPSWLSFIDVPLFFGIEIDILNPSSWGAFDMVQLRDNLRQAYADLVQLSRLLTVPQGHDLLPLGAPDGTPEITATEVLFSAHSLGAIIGAGYSAVDRDCPLAVLSAGAAGVTDILLHSDFFGSFITAMQPPGTARADVEAFFPILQVLVDRGDPGNFAPALQRAPFGAPGSAQLKHVLFQSIEQDTMVPNPVNERLGRAAGLPHLPPIIHPVAGLPPGPTLPAQANGQQGRSAGFFQLDESSPGVKAEHNGVFFLLANQTQWVHFIETYIETGTPEMIDPYATLGF